MQSVMGLESQSALTLFKLHKQALVRRSMSVIHKFTYRDKLSRHVDILWELSGLNQTNVNYVAQSALRILENLSQ